MRSSGIDLSLESKFATSAAPLGREVNENAAYLKWKYEENPYLNTTPVYVAVKAMLKNNRFNLWNESGKLSLPTVLVRSIQDPMRNIKWTLNDLCLLDIGSWDLRMV